MRLARTLVAAGAVVWLGTVPAHAERVALVIGNGTYDHADKLANR
jgi:hypothetical protein